MGRSLVSSNVWSKILDKIDAALDQWEQVNLSMEGRRLIVQMVIGSISQYPSQIHIPQVIVLCSLSGE